LILESTLQKCTKINCKTIKLTNEIIKKPNWLNYYLTKKKVNGEKFIDRTETNMNQLNMLKPLSPSFLNLYDSNETEFLSATNNQPNNLKLMPYEELNNDPSLKKSDDIKVTTNISKSCILS
jgi:hypothetical protein